VRQARAAASPPQRSRAAATAGLAAGLAQPVREVTRRRAGDDDACADPRAPDVLPPQLKW
jgi:hypothetical protein